MSPTDDQTETTTTDPFNLEGLGQFRLKTTDGHRVTSRRLFSSDSERQGKSRDVNKNVLVANEVLRLE